MKKFQMMCLVSKDKGIFQFQESEIRVSESGQGFVAVVIENTGDTTVPTTMLR